VSGIGIRWAICKSAPHLRQISMPAPHYSDFYRPVALPAAQPTVSKHWYTYTYDIYVYKYLHIWWWWWWQWYDDDDDDDDEQQYSTFSRQQWKRKPTSTCGTVTLTLLPCSISITAGCAGSIDAGLKSTTTNMFVLNHSVITTHLLSFFYNRRNLLNFFSQTLDYYNKNKAYSMTWIHQVKSSQVAFNEERDKCTFIQ